MVVEEKGNLLLGVHESWASDSQGPLVAPLLFWFRRREVGCDKQWCSSVAILFWVRRREVSANQTDDQREVEEAQQHGQEVLLLEDHQRCWSVGAEDALPDSG